MRRNAVASRAVVVAGLSMSSVSSALANSSIFVMSSPQIIVELWAKPVGVNNAHRAPCWDGNDFEESPSSVSTDNEQSDFAVVFELDQADRVLNCVELSLIHISEPTRPY